MKVKIFKSLYQFVKEQLNLSNLSSKKRLLYKKYQKDSQIQLAYKVFSYIYSKWQKYRTKYGDIQINKEEFYKITNSYRLNKKIIDTLVKKGIIKKTVNNGRMFYDGYCKSTSYKLGYKAWIIYKDNIQLNNKQHKNINLSIKQTQISPSNHITIEKKIIKKEDNKIICLEQEKLYNIVSSQIPADLKIYSRITMDIEKMKIDKVQQQFIDRYQYLSRQKISARPCKKCYRFQHWFNHIPKYLRKYALLDEIPLIQVWDKSCAYPSFLAVLINQKKNNVSSQQLYRYIQEVSNKDIYKNALMFAGINTTKQNRNQIKSYFQRFIQGTFSFVQRICNSLGLKRIGPKKSDLVNPVFQRAVVNYYKFKFPKIYQQIVNWPTRIDYDGKKRKVVKTINVECTKLQTDSIHNGICKKLSALNIKWITLHDAIFVVQSDKDKLKGFNFDNQFWLFNHLFSVLMF